MRFNFWIVISILAIAAVCAASNNVATVDPKERVDCFPDPNPEEAKCEERGCIWDNATYDENLNVPLCYFPKTTGFVFKNATNLNEWILRKPQPATPFVNPGCPFESEFEMIKVSTRDFGKVFNIRIEPTQQRFEPDIRMNNADVEGSDSFYLVPNDANTNTAFTFKIKRNSTGTAVWDTSLGGLMFADRYIQITTKLPTDKMYGFGENAHQTLKHDFSKYKTWSMLARDEPPNSVGEDTKNLYGVHPFYMMLEEDGKAHGVFILNSNAQEVTTGPGPHLVYRTIGGILDIYFFPGPSPEKVVQQYLSMVGKPFMPPYWALGFQLSRYGYKNLEDLKTTVERNLHESIPLEVVYADIDYMNRYADFTTGEDWSGFGDYVKELHKKDLKVILIFDPAIDVTTEPFKRALNANASFIEYDRADQVQADINGLYSLTKETKIMLSVVWPDHHTAFPDFYDPAQITQNWWKEEIKNYHKQIEFDGIWIDMNEPAAFGTNEEHPWYFDNPDHPNITSLKCDNFNESDGVYDYAPFQTSAVYRQDKGTAKQSLLSQKTLCMLARTHRGKEVFYNTKNLYGLYESIVTYEAAEEATEKRAAVISRSTFPSSGRYAGHWLGDNSATWNDLRTSVIGAQEFNIFGIPYIGSDVCGFNGDTTEELCLRWQQVGAFHPFFRNHNNNASPPQDPALWATVANATRIANKFRYSFLTYLYSLHFEAAKYGKTVIRPVFFEFPNDPNTHNLSYQFMWGNSIMVVPVVYENATEVSAYLPTSAVWYSLRESDFGLQAQSNWTVIEASLSELIPVYIKGGTIIPRQMAQKTTTATRSQPLELIIAGEKSGDDIKAAGSFYWDDGISIIFGYSIHSHCEVSIAFTATNLQSSIVITPLCVGNVTLPHIDSLTIFGYSFNDSVYNLKVGNESIDIFSTEFDNEVLKIGFLDIEVPTNSNSTKISWDSHQPSTTVKTTSKPTTTATASSKILTSISTQSHHVPSSSSPRPETTSPQNELTTQRISTSTTSGSVRNKSNIFCFTATFLLCFAHSLRKHFL